MEGAPARGFQTLGKPALALPAAPSVIYLLDSCSAVRGKGHKVWLLPSGSPSPQSVCVSSDKAVLPGDPDYIQYLLDYTHRPAWSFFSWAFVLLFSFAFPSPVPFI